MLSSSYSGIGAGLPSNETMLTTPVHFRIGSASSGSNFAKQYPGNNGQSIFFFRSFQRLQRVSVGRNASIFFCSSCSRTTCSWRERVQIANHCASACMSPGGTRLSVGASLLRSRCRALLLQPFLEGVLHVLVLPLDDRLRPQLLEVFH